MAHQNRASSFLHFIAVGPLAEVIHPPRGKWKGVEKLVDQPIECVRDGSSTTDQHRALGQFLLCEIGVGYDKLQVHGLSLSLSLHFANGDRWLAYLAEIPKFWIRHDEAIKCFRLPGHSSRRQDGLQVRPLDRRA